MTNSHLGTWEPESIEERLDRMESYAALQQLVARYARALDARDMGAVAALFDPEVQVGAKLRGRDALETWMSSLMRASKTSVHFVAEQVIDFNGPDSANGIVYCRDELERPEKSEWSVGAIQYWDEYARIDGTWLFKRRQLHRWYLVDALDRPGHAKGINDFGDQIREKVLPDAYASWAKFWDTKAG